MGGTVLSYNSDKAVEEARMEEGKLNDMLYAILLEEGKYEDMKKCTSNISHKTALMKEYGLLN